MHTANILTTSMTCAPDCMMEIGVILRTKEIALQNVRFDLLIRTYWFKVIGGDWRFEHLFSAVSKLSNWKQQFEISS